VCALDKETPSTSGKYGWNAAAQAARTLSAESVALEAALNQCATEFGAGLPDETTAGAVKMALQLWDWARQGGAPRTAVIPEEGLLATCLLACALRILGLKPPPPLAPLIDSALARPGSAPAIEELLAIQGAPPSGGIVLQVSDLSNASPALLQRCVVLAAPIKAKAAPLSAQAEYAMKLNPPAISSAVQVVPYGPQKQFAAGSRRLLIDDLNLPSQPALPAGRGTAELGAEAILAARKVCNTRSVMSEVIQPGNRRRNMSALSGLAVGTMSRGPRLLAPRRPPAVVFQLKQDQTVISPSIKLPPRVPVPGTCGSTALHPGACLRPLVTPYAGFADLAPVRGPPLLDLPRGSAAPHSNATLQSLCRTETPPLTINGLQVATTTDTRVEVEVSRSASAAAKILEVLGAGEGTASWDHRKVECGDGVEVA
jgi:hypothetical protein